MDYIYGNARERGECIAKHQASVPFNLAPSLNETYSRTKASQNPVGDIDPRLLYMYFVLELQLVRHGILLLPMPDLALRTFPLDKPSFWQVNAFDS